MGNQKEKDQVISDMEPGELNHTCICHLHNRGLLAVMGCMHRLAIFLAVWVPGHPLVPSHKEIHFDWVLVEGQRPNCA